jgi:hypothetical protein
MRADLGTCIPELHTQLTRVMTRPQARASFLAAAALPTGHASRQTTSRYQCTSAAAAICPSNHNSMHVHAPEHHGLPPHQCLREALRSPTAHSQYFPDSLHLQMN